MGGDWKPDRAEAQFLGEMLNLDPKLAQIARGMLAKGHPLDYVVKAFKDAVRIAAMARANASPALAGDRS